MRARWDEDGSVMVEYGLVLALLSFAFMGGMAAVTGATHAAQLNLQSQLLSYGLRTN
jgi:Flp pilus assembly pilin Flp